MTAVGRNVSIKFRMFKKKNCRKLEGTGVKKDFAYYFLGNNFVGCTQIGGSNSNWNYLPFLFTLRQTLKKVAFILCLVVVSDHPLSIFFLASTAFVWENRCRFSPKESALTPSIQSITFQDIVSKWKENARLKLARMSDRQKRKIDVFLSRYCYDAAERCKNVFSR